jgi:anti-sigma factor RsiW
MRSLKARVGSMAVTADAGAAAAVFTRFERAQEYGAPGGSAGSARWFFRPRLLHAAAAAVLLAVAVFGLIAFLTPATSTAAIVVNQHRLRMVGRLILDTHANCCKDLQEWFEAQAGRPVTVPEIAYKGTTMEGGTLYGHGTGNTIFVAAYMLEDKPLTLCICSGPNMSLGEGEPFSAGRISGRINKGEDYTLISWQRGLDVVSLVTPFDEEKSRAILASVK